MSKCYCGTRLREDGACPFRCPPALAAPRSRERTLGRKLRKRQERADSKQAGTVLTRQEIRVGLARVDPGYFKQHATASKRSRAMWSKLPVTKRLELRTKHLSPPDGARTIKRMRAGGAFEPVPQETRTTLLSKVMQAGERQVARRLNLSIPTLGRVLAGLPVAAGTRSLIREYLRGQSKPAQRTA